MDENIKKTKFTILLIRQETLNRAYVSYEIDKSVEHGNTIISILIDNDDSLSKEDEFKMYFDKLPKKFYKKIRWWYKECGRDNIINWLNEKLGI